MEVGVIEKIITDRLGVSGGCVVGVNTHRMQRFTADLEKTVGLALSDRKVDDIYSLVLVGKPVSEVAKSVQEIIVS